MGLQIPGYAAPTPYAQNPDIVGQFGKGFDLGSNITNEMTAKDALGEFVRSLYSGAATPSTAQPMGAPAPAAAPPQPVAPLAMSNDPGNQLIGKSAAAASGSADPVLTQYFKTLAQRESGGDPNAQNPNSSAGGTYQITDPTWNALVAQNPGTLTPDGKMDPQQQQVAVRLLTQQNAAALKNAGQPVNPGTLYAAHFLGAPTATQVLGYADNTPMSSAVAPEVIQANPHLAQMNVGQFKQWAGVSGQTPQGGYQPPQQTPNGLPPQDVMMALIQNPSTRDFAAQMIQARINPKVALDMASTQADINLKEAQAKAWGSGLKTGGYVVGPNGQLMAAPGGQADPNNPLNYNKVNPFGQTTGPDGSGGAATADAVPVQLGTDGKAIPQQQADYIKTLPANMQPLVAGVINYTLDPNKVVSLKGNARMQLIAAAKAADPTFDMAAYPARAAMVKSLASGPMQQTLSSVNTTIQHLGELDGQVDGLHNGGFVPFNGIAQAASAATGHQEPIVFAQTAQAAANELAKFFKGAGVTDVQGIKEWQDTISSSNSPEQLHGAIKNAIGSLLQAKLNTLQEQYKATMGGGTLPGFLSSQSVATLKNLGIDPHSLDPAVGADGAPAGDGPPPPPNGGDAPTIAVNPATGEKLQLVNGQWVPLK